MTFDMQTNLPLSLLATRDGKEADAILRNCVHCGFCTATCPTYQLLGDELDSPRGRIYLIKQALEGAKPTRTTQYHLDRCLTCRSCETTCPSGVRYGRLVDIGRHYVAKSVKRPLFQRIIRRMLRFMLPFPNRLKPFYWLGLVAKPILPAPIKHKIPPLQARKKTQINSNNSRKMLVLEGCAQSVMTPATNDHARAVLNRLGISLISAKGQGCCGAVDHHLDAETSAKAHIRRNIDAWWPHIEEGAEAVIVTASGCAVQVKDYGNLMAEDPNYSEKANILSKMTRDIAEVLAGEDLTQFKVRKPQKVAFHAPCTLQHGQKLTGVVEGILTRLGYRLHLPKSPHLCCGSAGTYSILQPTLSKQLRDQKLSALTKDAPDLIVTANIGCQLHLQSATQTPVTHWISLLN